MPGPEFSAEIKTHTQTKHGPYPCRQGDPRSSHILTSDPGQTSLLLVNGLTPLIVEILTLATD